MKTSVKTAFALFYPASVLEVCVLHWCKSDIKNLAEPAGRPDCSSWGYHEEEYLLKQVSVALSSFGAGASAGTLE